MEKFPIISNRFTLEDIHKIREFDYETTKNMTFEERKAYYRRGAEDAQRQMEIIRREK